MSEDLIPIVTSVSLGISLAAASGMRVFLPLFISGLILRFDLFPIPGAVDSSQLWLSSTAAIVCFGVASLTEAIAYKVPFLDHILDVLGAPAALVAGALLTTTFLVGMDDPVLKYGLGVVAGAGSAGIVHGATSLARVVSTKTTGGMANPAFAVGELVSAFFTSVLGFVMPFVVVFCLVAIAVLTLFFVKSRLTKKADF